MLPYDPCSKFQYTIQLNRVDRMTCGTFQVGLSRSVESKGTRAEMKKSGKAKISTVIEDNTKVPHPRRSGNRIWTTDIHVQQVTNTKGMVTIVGIWLL